MSAESGPSGGLVAGGRTPLRGPALPRPAVPQITPGPARRGRELEPSVRGAGLLKLLEQSFLLLDRLVGRFIPERLNPLLHTGAIATTALLIATATGVLELIWYRPSLPHAFGSVAWMAARPWTAGLVRSLHRYSSDLAMCFALIHALRLLFERRFSGARWLAWVTGVAAVAILGFIGWTGYWMVWDTRAHAVAVGTARVFDVLPIFADPMGRSFLTDRSLNSLVFFVVFFVHMLVPLAAGVALWLHLTRLSRPEWVTRRTLTLWTSGALLALAAVLPADLAGRAHMTEIRRAYAIDAWYLAPLYLTDRLGGGGLWAVMLVSGIGFSVVPWALARRRKGPAHIHVALCSACTQCVQDCPYDAISMVPRTDGSRKHSQQAEVNPARCVECGICASSCDSVGTDLSWFGMRGERERVEGWLRLSLAAGQKPVVVYACAEAAGGDLDVDAANGRCARLPNALVHQVPCAGWVHALTVERVLRLGAAAVAVVGCGPGQCHYREGHEWMRQHLDGERDPQLRADKAPRERIHILSLDRTRGRDLVRAIGALHAGAAPAPAGRSPALVAAAAVVLAALVMAGVGAFSVFGYASPSLAGSELVVTFKHPGAVSEHFRVLSPEEKAKLPIQMRRDRIYERARASVRMRVAVDGRRVVDRAYPPKGLWHDGNSIAVEVLPMTTGSHEIEVEIGDTHEQDEWHYATRQRLEFTRSARRVIVFDRLDGFTIH